MNGNRRVVAQDRREGKGRAILEMRLERPLSDIPACQASEKFRN
jgi:hypothetical protein